MPVQQHFKSFNRSFRYTYIEQKTAGTVTPVCPLSSLEQVQEVHKFTWSVKFLCPLFRSGSLVVTGAQIILKYLGNSILNHPYVLNNPQSSYESIILIRN